jgi:adenine-specific DNA-methyltransferase
MGTHGAFKKIGPDGEGWKERARERLLPKLELIIPGTVTAERADLLTFFTGGRIAEPVDVVYIDPPYNNRQYGANYHLYENLVLYDKPTVHGKTGLRDWAQEGKSRFCVADEAMDFLLQVVKAAPAHLVFVSYSSDGLLSTGRSPQLIVDRLLAELDCTVAVHMRRQRRYCADLDRENNDQPLCEYLFEVEK